MYVLQLQQTGLPQLLFAFEQAREELSDWREQLEKLEPESTVIIQQRFDTEGPGWIELTPAYKAWKDKHYPGKTILRRTDEGYLSFQKDESGNVTRINQLTAEFGSEVAYLFHLNDKRPIIDQSLLDQNEERFMQIVTDAKTGKFRDIGLIQ